MRVDRIEDGFWRWTAPHPAWKPADSWARDVGCVYLEPPVAEPDALVLIDPLAPAPGTEERERFWRALDRDVERLALPVAVVVSNRFHSRDAAAFRERYGGARVLLPEGAYPTGALGDETYGNGEMLPGGVLALSIEGLEPGETALWIPSRGSLVIADAVIGAGGGDLRLAPASWGVDDEAGRARYRERFSASVRRLLDLEPRRVLPSHGEPVLENGAAALRRALSAPAWGES